MNKSLFLFSQSGKRVIHSDLAEKKLKEVKKVLNCEDMVTIQTLLRP